MNASDLKQMAQKLDTAQVLDALGLQPKTRPLVYIAPAAGSFAIGFIVGAALSMVLRPSARRPVRALSEAED